MIFTPYSFEKNIEESTLHYKTILYSKPNKTLYKIIDNIKDIETLKSNTIENDFFVVYSEFLFSKNDNSENIKKIIQSKDNNILSHMKDNFIKCFKVDTNIVNNIQLSKTQKHIISNLDRYLTIYNKVKLNIEKIFKDAIPKTHYAGAIQNSDKSINKIRARFEKNLTSKNGIKLIIELIKSELEKSSNLSPNRLLYNETISHFIEYLIKFLNELILSTPKKLTSTKLLREQKLNIITFVANEFLKSDLKINNCQLTEANNRFKYILRKIKYNNIIYTSEKSNLAIENEKIIDNIDEIKIIPKEKEISSFFKLDEINLNF